MCFAICWWKDLLAIIRGLIFYSIYTWTFKKCIPLKSRLQIYMQPYIWSLCTKLVKFIVQSILFLKFCFTMKHIFLADMYVLMCWCKSLGTLLRALQAADDSMGYTLMHFKLALMKMCMFFLCVYVCVFFFFKPIQGVYLDLKAPASMSCALGCL